MGNHGPYAVLILEELLADWYSARHTAIYERSGNITTDIRRLDAAWVDYREQFSLTPLDPPDYELHFESGIYDED